MGTIFWALVTRAGTPAPVVNQVHTDVIKALQNADVRKRLENADIETVASSPAQCDSFLREQVTLWGGLVKASGARVN
jgi:tripartite-type tricarboxylate transporter receptor subunit TctC